MARVEKKAKPLSEFDALVKEAREIGVPDRVFIAAEQVRDSPDLFRSLMRAAINQRKKNINHVEVFAQQHAELIDQIDVLLDEITECMRAYNDKHPGANVAWNIAWVRRDADQEPFARSERNAPTTSNRAHIISDQDVQRLAELFEKPLMIWINRTDENDNPYRMMATLRPNVVRDENGVEFDTYTEWFVQMYATPLSRGANPARVVGVSIPSNDMGLLPGDMSIYKAVTAARNLRLIPTDEEPQPAPRETPRQTPQEPRRDAEPERRTLRPTRRKSVA